MRVSAAGMSVADRAVFQSRTLMAERLNAGSAPEETESSNWRIFGGKISLPHRGAMP